MTRSCRSAVSDHRSCWYEWSKRQGVVGVPQVTRSSLPGSRGSSNNWSCHSSCRQLRNKHTSPAGSGSFKVLSVFRWPSEVLCLVCKLLQYCLLCRKITSIRKHKKRILVLIRMFTLINRCKSYIFIFLQTIHKLTKNSFPHK